jgi:Spy/CpxP family protein refolding chaperone
MKNIILLAALLLVTPLVALSQTQQSPYAGQERQDIRTLSADEIQAYMTGQGAGLAKAAELNNYPGPRHVLELAEQLQLSDVQKAQAEKIRADMLSEATRLGPMIVEKERELNHLFAGNKIDGTSLASVVGEIARLQGELRITHLRAHLELRRVLSDAQVKKYDELPGYGSHNHQHN